MGSCTAEMKVGDHVIPAYMADCKECELCDWGKNNIFQVFRFNFMSGVAYTDKKCRFSLNGKPIHHFLGLSTFSEYTVVHVSCVAKMNPEAPLDKICLLGCGVPVGLGAPWNVGKVKPGDSVAIFGLGTIGLAICQSKTREGLMASCTAGEVITCKAGVVWEAGQPITIQQIQVAPPQSKEVRIRITHTSLCATDLLYWKGKDGGAWFPRILGHEGAGIVESVGSEVTEVKAGDHVIPAYMADCKECELCDRGKNNICQVFRFNYMSGVAYTDKKCRFSLNGKPIHHFIGLSTFSEYTVVHVSCVAKVNPEAPLDKICLLGCGVAAGLGAPWNAGKVKPGDSVAIFGLGTIGLAVAEGARIAGASRILGIDINPEKEEISKQFGVTEYLNPTKFDKPIQEVIREMTKGGVDSSYECVGRVELMLAALQCSHRVWGRTLILGLDEMDKELSFNPLEILEGRKLKYVAFGGFKKSDIPRLVDKYMNNEFDLDKYVTQRMAFSDINVAMEMLIAGKCLRCVLHMDEDCPN